VKDAALICSSEWVEGCIGGIPLFPYDGAEALRSPADVLLHERKGWVNPSLRSGEGGRPKADRAGTSEPKLMANEIARRLRKPMTPREVKLWFICAHGNGADFIFVARRRAIGSWSIFIWEIVIYCRYGRRNKITAVFERVRTWPEDGRRMRRGCCLNWKSRTRARYRLTDEQLAEVRRRRAKKNPTYVSLAAASRRLGV